MPIEEFRLGYKAYRKSQIELLKDLVWDAKIWLEAMQAQSKALAYHGTTSKTVGADALAWVKDHAMVELEIFRDSYPAEGLPVLPKGRSAKYGIEYVITWCSITYANLEMTRQLNHEPEKGEDEWEVREVVRAQPGLRQNGIIVAIDQDRERSIRNAITFCVQAHRICTPGKGSLRGEDEGRGRYFLHPGAYKRWVKQHGDKKPRREAGS